MSKRPEELLAWRLNNGSGLGHSVAEYRDAVTLGINSPGLSYEEIGTKASHFHLGLLDQPEAWNSCRTSHIILTEKTK